jgi:hypothetical protein
VSRRALRALILFSVLSPCLCVSVVKSVFAAGFVPGTEDVPLMPGLAPTEKPVVFDKPQGRIVEAAARGKVTRDGVRRFYKETLPGLGWREEAGEWRREAEALRIETKGRDGDLRVEFSLSPR